MTLATDTENPESGVKSLMNSDVLVEENSIQRTGKEHTEVWETSSTLHTVRTILHL